MKGNRLRPLTALEEKLCREKITEIEAMSAQDGAKIDGKPSRGIVDAAKRLSALFGAIGFVSTSAGVLVLEDGDELDEIKSLELQRLIERGWAQAESALRADSAST